MCLSGKLDWKRRLHLTLGTAVWGGAVPGAAGSVHPRGVSGNSRWGCATAGLLTWRAQGGSVRRLGTGSRPRALAHLPPPALRASLSSSPSTTPWSIWEIYCSWVTSGSILIFAPSVLVFFFFI